MAKTKTLYLVIVLAILAILLLGCGNTAPAITFPETTAPATSVPASSVLEDNKEVKECTGHDHEYNIQMFGVCDPNWIAHVLDNGIRISFSDEFSLIQKKYGTEVNERLNNEAFLTDLEQSVLKELGFDLKENQDGVTSFYHEELKEWMYYPVIALAEGIQGYVIYTTWEGSFVAVSMGDVTDTRMGKYMAHYDKEYSRSRSQLVDISADMEIRHYWEENKLVVRRFGSLIAEFDVPDNLWFFDRPMIIRTEELDYIDKVHLLNYYIFADMKQPDKVWLFSIFREPDQYKDYEPGLWLSK